MSELTAADVETFTRGRLKADDPEVSRSLTAALAAARRECGWHVSPVKSADTIALDATGDRVLTLPTYWLVELKSVTDDGNEIDLERLRPSYGRPPGGLGGPVTLRYRNSNPWRRFHRIEIVADHGYTDLEATDWREAILNMVDQMSMVPIPEGAERSDADMTRKTVDDVTYGWTAQYATPSSRAVYSFGSTLDAYRLPGVMFR